MTRFKLGLAAAAAIGGLSAPALAQNPYPYGYGQQPGYQQGYNQNPITSVIDQLLGNRYNVTDRRAVSQCASAAMVQANAQYGGRNGYNQGYNNQGYNGSNSGYAYNRGSTMRVTSITNVQRRSNGLRVSGLMSSGGYNGQYGNQNGYQNQAYARGDVSFRCNVDYRGQVTDVRIGRNNRG